MRRSTRRGIIRWWSIATSLPRDLNVTAETGDGLVMGLAHSRLPVHGVQFHPESIASEYGHLLLKNFLEIAQAWNSAKPARRGAWAPLPRRSRGSFEDRAVSIEFRSLIAKVATGAALAREEAAAAFEQMMSGEATPSQMGGLLWRCACAAKASKKLPARSASCARRCCG